MKRNSIRNPFDSDDDDGTPTTIPHRDFRLSVVQNALSSQSSLPIQISAFSSVSSDFLVVNEVPRNQDRCKVSIRGPWDEESDDDSELIGTGKNPIIYKNSSNQVKSFSNSFSLDKSSVSTTTVPCKLINNQIPFPGLPQSTSHSMDISHMQSLSIPTRKSMNRQDCENFRFNRDRENSSTNISDLNSPSLNRDNSSSSSLLRRS